MNQVICFGEILWDRFKNGKKAGGAPMNVALHLQKQGVNSVLISSVGDDPEGKELLNFVKDGGLAIDSVQIDNSLPTGVVEVQLDEKNQATYTIVKPVAWDNILFRKEFDSMARTAEAVVFGSLACRENTSKETLTRTIKQARLRVFDMNLRPPHYEQNTLNELLKLTDILKINEDELTFLSNLYSHTSLNEQERLEHLSKEFGLNTICVTLGERGAMVWQQGRIYSHPGYQVKVADTVGAGDAFLATFIKGILQKESIEDVLARSCATGALVASHSGANPAYSHKDILKIQGT